MVWVRFSTRRKKKVDSVGSTKRPLNWGLVLKVSLRPGRGGASTYSRGRPQGVIQKPRVKELELGAEALAPRRSLLNSPTDRPTTQHRLRLSQPGPSQQQKARTLPSASRPRLAPLAAVPANPHGHRPQARLPSPDWTGPEPGTSRYQSGSPLPRPHARSPVLTLRPSPHRPRPRPRPLPHPQGSGSDLPSREVPISWSSIARIWACADMAAA